MYLGFETTRRARVNGLKLVWGCLLTDGDFTKWRQAMRTHGLNPVACYVSFETRAFEIYAHCRLVQGRYLPDDTVQFVS